MVLFFQRVRIPHGQMGLWRLSFQVVSDARVHWATTLFLVDLGVGPTFLGHKTRVLVGWECCGLEISEFIPLFSVTVPKSQP